MSDLDLDSLRAELDDFAVPEKKGGRSSREERIVAGFDEIQRFAEQHGHAPQHGEDREIFERLYAVRLDRLRMLEECRSLLTPLDRLGLLGGAASVAAPIETMDADELLAELGGAIGSSDITDLRHVRTSAEKRAAEEIANRDPCPDFGKFKPLFTNVQRDLDTGVRTTRSFVKDAGFLKADITEGQFFILGGQIAYVAEVGETFKAPNGEYDARLRVIYSNGTQSNLLRRSLQRALYKDEAGRRITDPSAGPLFGEMADDGDLESGTIYVLRSKSDHPGIVPHRELIHKIGVTGGKVETRIAHAALDATYLLADVDVVATYKLFNINRTRLENLLHRIFAPARLDLTIEDRFGNPVKPREWYLVPLSAVDQAVEKIRDGSITKFRYDPQTARLVQQDGSS
ncbi:MAG: GIY-YIG nuclease family protein [Mesorhizobium sp.]|uniref:GIY-YIG nuclease family protein n=1 Tax=Mesorhizobium sp. TaxID=1871066 RepID=UPI00120B8714|nr:GIY-YIG nuclease family protein [Mesorhizobium sp.]TIR25968.1 MAG: GIY-YIG nuclease family protein [Mesorhizobium sp.]